MHWLWPASINSPTAMSTLFRKKPMTLLLEEAAAEGQGTLRRVLGPWGLIALGVGIIVGAGLFSVTGTVAGHHTGPAITLSFIIAAIGCGFAGLCYAEFASRIPVSGSAYTYAYATMGEFMAWLVGWNIVLEYAVGSTLVSISWSQYMMHFLRGFGINLPQAWTACPSDGGIMNLPAAFIVCLMSIFLIRGTRQSAWVNNAIVFIKIAIILVFIVMGWAYINTDNYTPYLPENTGVFGEYGWSGVLRGAGVAFFAFLGFDAVSTAAQETRNPSRNVPIGILGSLFLVTVLYILFGHVLTGVANYTEFQGSESVAPVAIAISHMPFPWLNRLIVIAILFGYSSVILVMLMAQSRVFMTMSRDGLLPPSFGRLHRRWRTPWQGNIILMVCVAVLASLVPGSVAGEMCSIGTLLAFTIVCGGVIIVRREDRRRLRTTGMTAEEEAARKSQFRVPMVPLIPLLGMAVCIGLMVFLPFDTWVRLAVWTVIGLAIYFFYSAKHSHQNK